MPTPTGRGLDFNSRSRGARFFMNGRPVRVPPNPSPSPLSFHRSARAAERILFGSSANPGDSGTDDELEQPESTVLFGDLETPTNLQWPERASPPRAAHRPRSSSRVEELDEDDGPLPQQVIYPLGYQRRVKESTPSQTEEIQKKKQGRQIDKFYEKLLERGVEEDTGPVVDQEVSTFIDQVMLKTNPEEQAAAAGRFYTRFIARAPVISAEASKAGKAVLRLLESECRRIIMAPARKAARLRAMAAAGISPLSKAGSYGMMRGKAYIPGAHIAEFGETLRTADVAQLINRAKRGYTGHGAYYED